MLESLLNKVAGLQVFNNTYFKEYLQTTASVVSHDCMFIIYVIDLSTKNKIRKRGFKFL